MIGRATNASINDTCRLQGAKLYVDAVSTGDVQKADEVCFLILDIINALTTIQFNLYRSLLHLML